MAIDKNKIIETARKFTLKGQIPKAIQEWQKLADEATGDGTIYNTIGDLFIKTGQKEEAIEAFGKAADIFKEAGFTLKTIAVCKKIIKYDTDLVDIYLLLGDLNAERGLKNNAIENYLCAVKFFLKNSKTKECIAAYRKIIEISPNNLKIRFQFAEMCLKEGLQNDATDEYLYIAESLQKKSDTEKAEKVYDKILSYDPANEKVLKCRNAAISESVVMDIVVDEDESSSEEEPWDQSFAKGCKYLENEEIDKAETLFEQLVKNYPAEMDIHEKLGYVYLKNDKFDRALDEFMFVIEDSMLVGDMDKVISLTIHYLEKNDSDIQAREILAKSYAASGEPEKAFDEYKILVETCISAGDENGWNHLLNSGLNLPESMIADLRGLLPEAEPVKESEDDFDFSFDTDFGDIDTESDESVDSAEVTEAKEAKEVDEFDDVDGVDEPDTSFDFSDVSEEVNGVGFDAQTDESMKDNDVPGIVVDDLSETTEAVEITGEPDKVETVEAFEITGEVEEVETVSAGISVADVPNCFVEADVYIKYGLPDRALEQMELVLSVVPDNIEAHKKIIGICLDDDEYKKAVESYLKLKKIYIAKEIPFDEIEDGLEEIDPDGSIREELSSAPPVIHIDMLSDEVTVEKFGEMDLRLSGESNRGEYEEIDAEEVESSGLFELDIDDDEDVAECSGSADDGDVDKSEIAALIEEAEFYAEQGLSEGEKAIYVKILKLDSSNEIAKQKLDGFGGEDLSVDEDEFVVVHDEIESADSDDAGVDLDDVIFNSFDKVKPDEEVELVSVPTVQSAAAEDEAFPDEAFPEDLEDMFVEPIAVVEPVKPVEMSNVESEFYDLSNFLDEDMTEESEKTDIADQTINDDDFVNVFKEFQQGIEQKVDSEDFETHYNLGIAYKEMGLLNEAIDEYHLSATSSGRLVDSLMMSAECYKMLGDDLSAQKELEKLIEQAGDKPEKTAWAKYDLAELYEKKNDLKKAYRLYREVFQVDVNIKDVAKKVANLEKKLSSFDDAEVPPNQDKRISYI